MSGSVTCFWYCEFMLPSENGRSKVARLLAYQGWGCLPGKHMRPYREASGTTAQSEKWTWPVPCTSRLGVLIWNAHCKLRYQHPSDSVRVMSLSYLTSLKPIISCPWSDQIPKCAKLMTRFWRLKDHMSQSCLYFIFHCCLKKSICKRKEQNQQRKAVKSWIPEYIVSVPSCAWK